MVGYRSAIGPGAEDMKQGVPVAIEWVSVQQRELGGDIQVLLPQMSVLDEHPLLSRFTKLPHVTVGTTRNRKGFGARIVLAAWPTSDDFAQVSSSERVKALCLLPWDAPNKPLLWVNAWAFSSGAEILGSALADRRVPVTLDPVVRVGLQSLAEIGEFGTMGHGFIKSTIKRLSEAGYQLPPADVEAFLIAHNFPGRLAKEAREYAQRIKTGHSLRDPSVGSMPKSIVESWRAAAKEIRPVD